MNFIRLPTTECVNILSAKSILNYNQKCNLSVLKRPRKIKGIIEPQPHMKVQLINGVNQPEFLKYLKPTVPYYGLQNIQLKGYDYVTLDQFKRFVIRTLKQLDVRIKDHWATPSEEFSLDKFQNESYGVEESIRLHIYERNIQIDELPSYKAQTLIELLLLSKPPGVRFTIEKHDPEVKKKLYMTDMELERAKVELKDWQRPWEEIIKTRRI